MSTANQIAVPGNYSGLENDSALLSSIFRPRACCALLLHNDSYLFSPSMSQSSAFCCAESANFVQRMKCLIPFFTKPYQQITLRFLASHSFASLLIWSKLIETLVIHERIFFPNSALINTDVHAGKLLLKHTGACQGSHEEIIGATQSS